MRWSMANHDELIRRMEQDDLEDRAAEQTHMTPRDYARARSVTPQLVYYYIRNGRISPSACSCGRRVIEVAEADEVFRFTNKEETNGS